jgi:hypothetical protein
LLNKLQKKEFKGFGIDGFDIIEYKHTGTSAAGWGGGAAEEEESPPSLEI